MAERSIPVTDWISVQSSASKANGS